MLGPTSQSLHWTIGAWNLSVGDEYSAQSQWKTTEPSVMTGVGAHSTRELGLDVHYFCKKLANSTRSFGVMGG